MCRKFVQPVYAALLIALMVISLVFLVRIHFRGTLTALILGLAGGAAGFVLRRRIKPLVVAKSQARLWLVAILLAGVAVRVVWLALVPTDPISDFQLYHQLGASLAQNGTFNGEAVRMDYTFFRHFPAGPTAFVMPGYPLLLAAGYRLFGVTVLWGYALNILLVVGMQLAVFYSVAYLAGEGWGLGAAAAVGFHPTLIIATSLLGTDLSGAALLVISAALLLWSSLRPRVSPLILAVGAGLTLGLAIHCRPFLILLIPVYVAAVYVWPPATQPLQHTRAAKLVALLVAVSLTLVPWVVRNYFVLGKPILTNTANSVALYEHNAPPSLDINDHSDPALYGTDEVKMAELRNRRALTWIRNNPGEFGKRGVNRIARTFMAESGMLRWAGVLGREGNETDILGPLLRKVIKHICTLWWGLLVGALLAGLLSVSLQRKSRLHHDVLTTQYIGIGLVVLALITVGVFTAAGQPRYHMLWIPFAYSTLAIFLSKAHTEEA